ASMQAGAAYLLLYNGVQCIGWLAILLLAELSAINNAPPYPSVTTLLQLFQTAAVLEIVHSAVRLVRSPVFTTAIQVFSRVLLVWGILYTVPDPSVTESIGCMLLIIAWSVTEVMRYGYYALNLIGFRPFPLLWARYSLFIVLYPMGVTGELLCIYAALPIIGKRGIYSISMPNSFNFAFDYGYCLIGIMLSYLVFFPQLYCYMFAQRKKMLRLEDARPHAD
ncbi:hypothetical protein BOX15_Mlig002296g2, partial [Macrostomum lignano]